MKLSFAWHCCIHLLGGDSITWHIRQCCKKEISGTVRRYKALAAQQPSSNQTWTHAARQFSTSSIMCCYLFPRALVLPWLPRALVLPRLRCE